jgi:hypothetical protein
MTIDNCLTLCTLAMGTINSIWLLALVIEIRRHNRECRAYNQRVSTPIQSTPLKAPPIDRRTTIGQRLGQQRTM